MSEHFERGSIVANGLDLCKRMDLAHIATGRQAADRGDTSGLWSALHWSGYNQRVAEMSAKVLTGDTLAAEWVAKGSPPCGATWSDEELAEAEEQADYGDVSSWESPFCNCSGNSGNGLCSTCGKKLLPF